MRGESASPGPCPGTRSSAENWDCSVQQVQEYRARGVEGVSGQECDAPAPHGGGSRRRQSSGSNPTAADPWGQWGSEPRGGGSKGWHRLRAVPAAGKLLWGQWEPLASPVLSWLLPVPIAQADPCPHGMAVMGACSGRGAWLPPTTPLPMRLLLPPGQGTSWALS